MLGKNNQKEKTENRKSIRLKPVLPNRPGFYAKSVTGPPETDQQLTGDQNLKYSSTEQLQYLKKLQEQEQDLLRYAEQLDRRDREIKLKEVDLEKKSLKLAENIALLEARKKLLQRKQDRLRVLENGSSHDEAINRLDSPHISPFSEDHSELVFQELKEKEQFLTSCEEILLRKSQQLTEKQIELEQFAEDLAKSARTVGK